MSLSNVRSQRSAFSMGMRSVLCSALVLAPQSQFSLSVARAQCCGESAPAPVATQTYRLDFQTVYDEPFVAAVPRAHEWAGRKSVKSAELKTQSMVLLGAGHCFRDQVLLTSPELNRFSSNTGMQKTFESSSLETICQMVASGVGLTVLPSSSVPQHVSRESLLRFVPFSKPVPDRRVVLVYRKSFPRPAAIEALRQAILDCPLQGVRKLDLPAT